MEAKRRRTQLFVDNRAEFLRRLKLDLAKLVRIAGCEGMRPVARLNGTSDLLWERIAPELFTNFSPLRFSEYTKVPLHLRRPPLNLHLTYSVGGAGDADRAVGYLRAGHSVAVVVPEDVKHGLVGLEMDIGPCTAGFVDGDEHDLRFLDPPGSIVLLKPKGHVRTDLMRPHILNELRAAAKAAA